MDQTPASATIDLVDAGPFGPWLSHARAALLGDEGSDVPCGNCAACCISSYSVPLRAQDAPAIAAVPAAFLLEIPGAHTIMTALSDGTCPMLSAGRCSIYRQRPQTCRDYDCRIFAAAGILAGGADREAINRRVQQWRFTYPTDDDRQAHAAVLSAARFIQQNASCFPIRLPTAPTGIAVLAIKVYQLFLDPCFQLSGEQNCLRTLIAASREFEQQAIRQVSGLHA